MKRPATVISLARHRGMVQSYEKTLASLNARNAENCRTAELAIAAETAQNRALIGRNIQLKNQLEAIEEKECTAFWAVFWSLAGAGTMLASLVCLSLIVWP